MSAIRSRDRSHIEGSWNVGAKMTKTMACVPLALGLAAFVMSCGGGEVHPPGGSPEVRLHAFVTSGVLRGDFGGLGAADDFCQTSAADAGLDRPTRYRAWLSASFVSAPARISADGPWYRLDDQLIARTMADLRDGTLDMAINLSEDRIFSVSGSAWTATNVHGFALPSESCSDWTSTAGSGQAGLTSSTSASWTDRGAALSCIDSARLYCLEDACTVTGKASGASYSGWGTVGTGFTVDLYSDAAKTQLAGSGSGKILVPYVGHYVIELGTLAGGTYYLDVPGLPGAGLYAPLGPVTLDCGQTVDIEVGS